MTDLWEIFHTVHWFATGTCEQHKSDKFLHNQLYTWFNELNKRRESNEIT